MTEIAVLESQSARILKHLQSGQTLTPLEALDKFGCFRLSARIMDLRNDGHVIDREMVIDGKKKYAQYSIKNPGAKAQGF